MEVPEMSDDSIYAVPSPLLAPPINTARDRLTGHVNWFIATAAFT